MLCSNESPAGFCSAMHYAGTSTASTNPNFNYAVEIRGRGPSFHDAACIYFIVSLEVTACSEVEVTACSEVLASAAAAAAATVGVFVGDAIHVCLHYIMIRACIHRELGFYLCTCPPSSSATY